LIDVSGGHVTAMFATLPSAVSLIQSGVVRALAVTGSHRSNILPNVPTVIEAGLPGVVVTTWNGVLAPAGTPPELLERLHKAHLPMRSPNPRSRRLSLPSAPRRS
jgi:tripartite-type tricarboxylate transporter receptor subunit TctC